MLLIHEYIVILMKTISFILICVFKTGIFPDTLKTTLVKPFHVEGDIDDQPHNCICKGFREHFS